MLGNSRVDNGFDSVTLARLGPAPRVNLATSDAMPAEMAALARDALAGGRLRVAYVGVDFNLAVSPRDPGPVRAIADAPCRGLRRSGAYGSALTCSRPWPHSRPIAPR